VTITITVCGPPGSVSGLTASCGIYTDRVVLSWQATANATYYRAYRYDGIATLQIGGDITGTTVTDTSVEPGPFYYHVVAYNTYGTGGSSDTVTGYRKVTDQEFFDQVYWEMESVLNWLQTSDITQSQPPVAGKKGGVFKYDVSGTTAYMNFTNFSDYYLVVNGKITISVNIFTNPITGTANGTLNITGIYTGYVKFVNIKIDCTTGVFTGGHYDVSQDGGVTVTQIAGTYVP
jgi:hypothetical protein